MKSFTVIGLLLDLVGVIILGIGEMMKGAASLRLARLRVERRMDRICTPDAHPFSFSRCCQKRGFANGPPTAYLLTINWLQVLAITLTP